MVPEMPVEAVLLHRYARSWPEEGKRKARERNGPREELGQTGS